MKDRETKYLVTTRHPAGYMDGEHTFTAHEDADGWYVTAKGFGCSKNYRTARDAVFQMCADHACTVTHLEEIH